MLEAQELTKSFGSLTAVNGVSLELGLDGREQVFIVGPNGAGKTTLINLLTGRLTPDKGVIRMDGDDITTMETTDRVEHGLVRSFQLVHVFDSMTIRENLRTALLSREGLSFKMLVNESSYEHIEAEIDELMDEFGLTAEANTVVSNLSHGDRKLLDVAITFALEPKYLLLDEPTSGVGQREKNELIETVVEASRTYGISTLTIEHDMDIVKTYADRIIALHQGEILAEGEPNLIETDQQLRNKLLGIKNE